MNLLHFINNKLTNKALPIRFTKSLQTKNPLIIQVWVGFTVTKYGYQICIMTNALYCFW